MYKFLSTEGKAKKVVELERNIAQLASVPGNIISYTDAMSITRTLGDLIDELNTAYTPKEVRITHEVMHKMFELAKTGGIPDGRYGDDACVLWELFMRAFREGRATSDEVAV